MKKPTFYGQKNLHFSLRVTVYTFNVLMCLDRKSHKSHIRFAFYFLRYITMAYFLNDVDDGGEVVLPLANSKFEVFRLTLISCLSLLKCSTELRKDSSNKSL